MLSEERLLPTETVDTDAPVCKAMGFAGIVECFTHSTIERNQIHSAVKLRRTGHEPGLTPRERESPVELKGTIAQIALFRNRLRLISPYLKAGVLRRSLDKSNPLASLRD